MSQAFKASLLVFKSQLAALCAGHCEIDEWERQHNAVRNAEHGRHAPKEGKGGIVKLSKGAKGGRWSQGMSVDYGENPHPSLLFQREADAASAYVAEFTSAKISMTDDAVKYATGIRDRVKELATEAKAKVKEANKAPVPA